VNKKAKEDNDDGPRVNDAIRTPFVRLVTDEGHQVVSRKEALQLAARSDMDLVEVCSAALEVKISLLIHTTSVPRILLCSSDSILHAAFSNAYGDRLVN
jgi:hypothetical protein